MRINLLHVGVTANILDSLGVTREKVREAGSRPFEPAMIADGTGEARRMVGVGEAAGRRHPTRRLAARRGGLMRLGQRLVVPPSGGGLGCATGAVRRLVQALVGCRRGGR